MYTLNSSTLLICPRKRKKLYSTPAEAFELERSGNKDTLEYLYSLPRVILLFSFSSKNTQFGDFTFQMQVVKVHALVGGLRSHMFCRVWPKTKCPAL